MKMTSILDKRFDELTSQMEAVEKAKRYERTEYFDGYKIDSDKILNWKVKARHLLAASCGENSVHLKMFIECEKPSGFRPEYMIFQELKAIFLAAKEDFQGGYIKTVRQLVQAEVYDTELDQARGLHKGGYHSAAAVIAGVVLETAMRNMCENAGLPVGNLNKMNTDLTKEGIYNTLVQKRITFLADIRNNAAHGYPEEFKPSDVADMISYIEKFIQEYL